MRAKKLAVLAVSAMVMSLSVAQVASAESTYFTYTYDFWNTAQDSPDAYNVDITYYGRDFGLSNLATPQSLFAFTGTAKDGSKEEKLYVCDTGNDRIVELIYEDGRLNFGREIKEYTDLNGNKAEFSKPYDIFVREDADGNELYYIADNGNLQIVILNEDLECIQLIRDPKDEALQVQEVKAKKKNEAESGEAGEAGSAEAPQETETEAAPETEKESESESGEPSEQNGQEGDSETEIKYYSFAVTKLVVDDTGRIYCIAAGVNKGLMCFDPDGLADNNKIDKDNDEKEGNILKDEEFGWPRDYGKFDGFIGANRVTYTALQRFWKVFSTEAQKDRMENFVPTEFNNIALTDDGFYLATTDSFDQWDMDAGKVFPVRKLNAMGSDIMIRNGYTNPIGDLSSYWGDAGGFNGCSRIVDAVSMPNETYYLLDKVRGRVFAYDSQGNLLYAFGGPGNKEGYLRTPTAIEAIGDELFVMDSLNGAIVSYALTDYGHLINNALETYQSGQYETSAEYWEKVQTYNGNYALSYIGVGRALLRQKDYKGAMKNFKVAYDFDNYSKAFKLYRKQWIEKNVAWLFAVAVVLMVLPLAFQRIRRFVEEVNEVE